VERLHRSRGESGVFHVRDVVGSVVGSGEGLNEFIEEKGRRVEGNVVVVQTQGEVFCGIS